MNTSIHQGGSPYLMEAEGQVVPCYRIFSKARAQIFVFLAHSGFVTSNPWKHKWNVSPSVRKTSSLLTTGPAGCNDFWSTSQLSSWAWVKISNHILKEQLVDSGQTGLSARRAAPAQPVCRGWAHTVVTIFSCVIWFVLSIELHTVGQKGRGWGKQRQGEPS